MNILKIFAIIFFPVFSYGQIDFPKWIFQTQYGIEKHDKRLFDYSEKETLLSDQPEDWGTHNWSLIFNRKIGSNNKINVFVGTGVLYEKATFMRPFDHFYFMKDSFYILRNLNIYEKFSLPIIVTAYLELGKDIYLNIGLNSNFLLYRKIDHSEITSDVFPYTESTFEINSFEVTTGINYQANKVLFGIHTRLLNYQKIDKIIFNQIIKDPRVEQKWEFNNPLRFDFSIAYML